MYLQAYLWNPSTLYLRPVLVLINARHGKKVASQSISACATALTVLPTASHKCGSICPSNYHRYLLVNQWALHRSASDLLSLQGSMPDQGADRQFTSCIAPRGRGWGCADGFLGNSWRETQRLSCSSRG